MNQAPYKQLEEIVNQLATIPVKDVLANSQTLRQQLQAELHVLNSQTSDSKLQRYYTHLQLVLDLLAVFEKYVQLPQRTDNEALNYSRVQTVALVALNNAALFYNDDDTASPEANLKELLALSQRIEIFNKYLTDRTELTLEGKLQLIQDTNADMAFFGEKLKALLRDPQLYSVWDIQNMAVLVCKLRLLVSILEEQ